ncbi:BRO family protein [Paenibacillus larvae]|nr:BRO family protein [Paenibacillus larvae]
MNQLQVFNFTGKDVRMIMKGGQPYWFVLKDVCSILELSNPRMVKERLSDDVSSTYSIHADSLGRLQPTTIINEDGLADVILKVTKSEAVNSGNG